MSRGLAWTEPEVEILRAHYAHKRAIDLVELFSGKTQRMIINKASQLKIKKAKEFWSTERKSPSRGWNREQEIRINSLGRHEIIPPMPGLLDHLVSMSGCMNSEIVEPNAGRRSYLARLEPVRPQIDAMLKQRISGYKIAQAIGVPHSTVYGYIKEIRAAA